jgi:DNA-binding response OmpR family regulator
MSRKVLIIEDRRENIVFIANNILRPEGWDVITARDGKLGLQKAIEEQPNLIITDLKLPTMHGLDVLEELNKRGYRIPTIVMTFHGSEETAIRAFRLGAVDYLIKPFEIEDMMSAIDRALKVGSDAQPTPAGVEKSVADKLARQKNEIERLKAQLQQQEKVLQEHYQLGQGQSGAADVARWQALLKERDATLATIKKQTIAQHQAMTQQINHLQAQLAEKDALLADLKGLPAESGQAPDGQGDGADLSALRAEKARTDKLVESLTRIIGTQQKAIEKHRKEAERLARELHALAAGIQMLGQSLSDQAGEMSSALVGEE